MDDQPSPGTTQLLEAASVGRRLADSVEIDVVLAEGRHRRSARRRRHQLGAAFAVAGLTVAAIAIPLAVAGRPSRTASTSPPTSRPAPVSTTPRRGIDGLPIGSLANWLLVAPEGAGGQTNASGHFDVYNLGTGAETTRAVQLHGLADYPWVAVGDDLVGIADIPLSGRSSTGEAFAMASDNAKLVPLGAADALWPAAQPGAVWLHTYASTSSAPSACTIHEVTTAGRSLGAADAIPCDRWIAGAVDGGLLSAPDTRRNSTLQIWNPASGRVVRTLADDVGAVLGMSSAYVLWEDSARLYVTDVGSGRTTRVKIPVPKGYLAYGQPVLAPSGPLVAILAVTPETSRTIEQPGGAGGACCVGYSRSGRGILEIYNVVTGGVLMTRAVPLSTAAEPEWTASDSFVVINTGDLGVAAVATWSSSFPVMQIATLGNGSFVDNQNDTLLGR